MPDKEKEPKGLISRWKAARRKKTPPAPGQPRIGLALGGGGAKGLAHIPILEALDQMGVTPSVISGASIGAVIGALYAGGVPGREIRQGVEDLVYTEGKRLSSFFLKSDLSRLINLIDPNFGAGGMFKGEKILELLAENLTAETFEELDIPLKVVAADFWERREVVFTHGPLLTAVRASMAIPIIFTPVVEGNRVLVDGGTVNPVPYDLLWGDCDLVVAVDVLGQRRQTADPMPSLWDNLFNTFQLMENTILKEKLKNRPPHLLVRPQLTGVGALEFHRAGEVLQMAQPARQELMEGLTSLLEAWEKHGPPGLESPPEDSGGKGKGKGGLRGQTVTKGKKQAR